MVKVPEPNVTLPPVPPPPAREAIELLKLFKFKIAEATLARLTALLAEKGFAAFAWKVPALMVVVPEYVLLVPFTCKTPLPNLVKPPVPVIAPPNCVVLAATLNWLAVPVNPIAFERVIAVEVFNCAVLLPALLSKLIAPLVLVKLASVLKSRIAVLEADGVTRILPPPEGPRAPAAVAAKVPALMVVVPV